MRDKLQSVVRREITREHGKYEYKVQDCNIQFCGAFHFLKESAMSVALCTKSITTSQQAISLCTGRRRETNYKESRSNWRALKTFISDISRQLPYDLHNEPWGNLHAKQDF